MPNETLSQVIANMLQTNKASEYVYRTCAAELLQNIQLEAIRQERKRQDANWGEQNHDPVVWMAILGEEFGELCQAVNETHFDNGPEERAKGGYENMRREAIQVAAVAVGFLECLDRHVIKEFNK